MANSNVISESGCVASEWKPLERGALRGFFDVTLPSGMTLRECGLYEKEGTRWVSPPNKKFEVRGEVKYSPLVEFVDRETKDKFSRAAIAALDEHLGEGDR